MNVAELLAHLSRRGIRLEADGERLRYHPRHAVTLEMLDQLKAHKAALLAIARPPISGIDPRADEKLDDANEYFWTQLSDTDRNYLLEPRNYPAPCPWCGGRMVHHPMCDELRQSWEPTIPFGKHAGERVSTIPRQYLKWLLRSGRLDRDLRGAIQQWLRSKSNDGFPTRRT